MIRTRNEGPDPKPIAEAVKNIIEDANSKIAHMVGTLEQRLKILCLLEKN